MIVSIETGHALQRHSNRPSSLFGRGSWVAEAWRVRLSRSDDLSANDTVVASVRCTVIEAK
jgi:hypothetical protein